MKISALLANKGGFVATVTPDSTVSQLLAKLAEFRIGAAVVSSDGGHISGIASERDVARALNSSGAIILDAPVSQIMTAVVATCAAGDAVEDLALQMTEQRVRHIPVLDEDAVLIGIVSIGDIVKARIDMLEEERKSLMSYITG